MTKDKFLRWVLFTMELFICAVVFNALFVPLNLVVGGSSGIAILLNDWFNLDRSLVVLIVTGITAFLAYFYLPKDKFYSVVYVSIMYPLFIKLTENLPTAFALGISDPLLIVILGGALLGFMSAVEMSLGFSSGGIILISEVIHKKTRQPVATINTFINFIIILLGSYSGIMNLIYAFLEISIQKLVYDRISLGISNYKTFHIISNMSNDITLMLKNEGYEYTIIKGSGAYKNENKDIIMCVLPSDKLNYIKEKVLEIDCKAFMLITDSYHVRSGSKEF